MTDSYPFKVGAKYTRPDVLNILGITDPGGGNWYTGLTAHNNDHFIFCGVGAAGRTGHDYDNHFREDNLVWHGRTGSRLNQPSIQKLLNPPGRIYIFYREDNRSPFTFAGTGHAVETKDTSPVEIIWAFTSNIPPDETLPDEIVEKEKIFEGAKKSITVNIYERDPNARRKCIQKWGVVCTVCNFDFQSRYVSLGEGFIHVHHLKPLGEIGERYQLDPINDLRPVCPNCHAMLHRTTPALSIEALQKLIRI